MDLSDSKQPQNDTIRKIEDIIDMQKANESYRQVAFSLPLETEKTESASGVVEGGARDAGGGAGLARSLESGLARPARTRALSLKKKPKKLRHKQRKSPLPDVVSWPSDSDITVLRMKLCLAGAGAAGRPEPAGDVVPGDGPHRPDGSSMVNLATLVLNSRSPSKRSLNIEEYLLPLSSWERAPPAPGVSLAPVEYKVFGATCSHSPHHPEKPSTMMSEFSEVDAGLSKASTKSKVARFLRLYFCPCCTCLYEMEKMREEPSEYEPWHPSPPRPAPGPRGSYAAR